MLSAFTELPGVMESGRTGRDRAFARLSDGFQLRLRCVRPDEYAVALVQGTGTEAHVDALQGCALVQGTTLTKLNARSEAAAL